MSETTTVRRMAATDFQTLHAQIDPDPVIELHRRLQMWASVPDVDGGALTPSAAIVPDETITAALAEITKLKSQLEEARAQNATEIERLQVKLANLQEAADQAVKIIDRNLYHQREKVEDAASILRALLNGSAK